MNTLANWEEVPLFDSEEAEAAYWAETRIEMRLMDAAVAAGTELSDSVTITLRIDHACWPGSNASPAPATSITRA